MEILDYNCKILLIVSTQVIIYCRRRRFFCEEKADESEQDKCERLAGVRTDKVIDRKRKSTFNQLLAVWLLLLALLFRAEAALAGVPDYSQPSNWAYYGIGDVQEKPADLFLVCPTVDMGIQGNRHMSLEDATMKENFVGALNMERGIYEENTRMYAPFYQQVSLPVYTMSLAGQEIYLTEAYEDVREAFRYYLEHLNAGRPVVLAGFSQGADMCIRLMKDFFADEGMRERLVAVYAIGWRLTEEETKEYPWLHVAAGERDTGGIITFNSEKVGVEESIIIPRGVKTLAVNPLNWMSSSEPAARELNLGACFTDYSGRITEEIPALTGAYIDENRGSLIVPDVSADRFPNDLIGEGIFHIYDYMFFYRNLQRNVAGRIEAYMEGK